MAIKSIKIQNIMAFQKDCQGNNGGEKSAAKGDKTSSDVFTLQFCDGVNIIIGENGVGKTTILKMIYAAAQWSIPETDERKTKRLLQFFSNNLLDEDLLKSKGNRGYSYFEVSDGKHKFINDLTNRRFENFGGWFGLDIQAVFIPTTEMLSHSKGFLALNQKYKLPFDETQVDIIVNASLPEARNVPDCMEGILSKLSHAIGGTILIENDVFYVLKENGRKIDFSLEAEGLRKLGLLWKLIRNGLLEKGTVLLWDEPEANLNPELFLLVVEILLELEECGVQIFITTHNYNLAKYFEIKRRDKKQVQYHNLYRELPKKDLKFFLNEGSTMGKSEYYLSQLNGNKIVDADERLLDEALKKNLAD